MSNSEDKGEHGECNLRNVVRSLLRPVSTTRNLLALLDTDNASEHNVTAKRVLLYLSSHVTDMLVYIYKQKQCNVSVGKIQQALLCDENIDSIAIHELARLLIGSANNSQRCGLLSNMLQLLSANASDIDLTTAVLHAARFRLWNNVNTALFIVALIVRQEQNPVAEVVELYESVLPSVYQYCVNATIGMGYGSTLAAMQAVTWCSTNAHACPSSTLDNAIAALEPALTYTVIFKLRLLQDRLLYEVCRSVLKHLECASVTGCIKVPDLLVFVNRAISRKQDSTEFCNALSVTDLVERLTHFLRHKCNGYATFNFLQLSSEMHVSGIDTCKFSVFKEDVRVVSLQTWLSLRMQHARDSSSHTELSIIVHQRGTTTSAPRGQVVSLPMLDFMNSTPCVSRKRRVKRSSAGRSTRTQFARGEADAMVQFPSIPTFVLSELMENSSTPKIDRPHTSMVLAAPLPSYDPGRVTFTPQCALNIQEHIAASYKYTVSNNMALGSASASTFTHDIVSMFRQQR